MRRGRGEEKKEEKRPGAMRAPLRPRFQRPRTQLVHLLLDVQPLARVLDAVLISIRVSIRYGVHVARSSRCWQVLRGDECDIKSKVVELRTTIKATESSDAYRVHHRRVTRLYSLDGRNAHTRDVIIVINCFPKAPGKIVKIEHVILWSLLMGVKTRLRRRRFDASTCEKRTWNAPEASSMMYISTLQIKRYNLYYFKIITLLYFIK